MRKTFAAAGLLGLIVVGCDDVETRSAHSQARLVPTEVSYSGSGKSDMTTFQMMPPPGAPYPSASATGWFWGAFLDEQHPNFGPLSQVGLRIHDLPCRRIFELPGGLGQLSREFYSLYLTTGSTGRVRVYSFNADCLSGNVQIGPFLPAEFPLFSEDVLVEIYLDSDDGDDGADTGPPLLSALVLATG